MTPGYQPPTKCSRPDLGSFPPATPLAKGFSAEGKSPESTPQTASPEIPQHGQDHNDDDDDFENAHGAQFTPSDADDGAGVSVGSRRFVLHLRDESPGLSVGSGIEEARAR